MTRIESFAQEVQEAVDIAKDEKILEAL